MHHRKYAKIKKPGNLCEFKNFMRLTRAACCFRLQLVASRVGISKGGSRAERYSTELAKLASYETEDLSYIISIISAYVSLITSFPLASAKESISAWTFSDAKRCDSIGRWDWREIVSDARVCGRLRDSEQVLMRHRIHNKTQKFRLLDENSKVQQRLRCIRFWIRSVTLRKCFAGWAKAIKLSEISWGFRGRCSVSRGGAV